LPVEVTVPEQLGIIYGVVFLTSLCSQFFVPARRALVGDVVAAPLRARASSLGQMTQNIATIGGMTLAAPLILTVGPAWAMAVNALSFVVSFACIAAVRPPPAAHDITPGRKKTFGVEFVEGLRFSLGDRVVGSLVLAAFLVMLGGGAINALGVYFLRANLHTTVAYLGLFNATGVASELLWLLPLGRLAPRLGLTRVFAISLLGLGILLMALARLTSLGPALGLLVAEGAFQAGLSVTLAPLLLGATPREKVGRAAAFLNTASTVGGFFSIIVGTVLASTLLAGLHGALGSISFGPYDTIFTGAGLLVALGGLFALLRLRGVHVEMLAEDDI
jgi:MFS family permease